MNKILNKVSSFLFAEKGKRMFLYFLQIFMFRNIFSILVGAFQGGHENNLFQNDNYLSILSCATVNSIYLVIFSSKFRKGKVSLNSS